MIKSEVENQRGVIAPVLLADDSSAMRASISDVLSHAGLSVVLAEDGFAALAQVVKHKPCLVIADVTMPRLDGYQFCALLKRNTDYRPIPVVLLSGADGRYDLARARLVGSDACLPRPVSAQSLAGILEQFVKTVDEPESA